MKAIKLQVRRQHLTIMICIAKIDVNVIHLLNTAQRIPAVTKVLVHTLAPVFTLTVAKTIKAKMEIL
jgi:hypothetical protein